MYASVESTLFHDHSYIVKCRQWKKLVCIIISGISCVCVCVCACVCVLCCAVVSIMYHAMCRAYTCSGLSQVGLCCVCTVL